MPFFKQEYDVGKAIWKVNRFYWNQEEAREPNDRRRFPYRSTKYVRFVPEPVWLIRLKMRKAGEEFAQMTADIEWD